MAKPEIKGSDPNVVENEKTGKSPQISTSPPPKQAWWTLGGPDISFAPVDPASVSTSNSASLKDDIESSREKNIHGSVFDDSGAAQFYQPVEKYEGRHRFDPDATWTPEEEQKLVRTVRIPLADVSDQSPHYDHGSGSNILFTAALLENLLACMSHVLRLATGSRQHLPSSIRQHAE